MLQLRVFEIFIDFFSINNIFHNNHVRIFRYLFTFYGISRDKYLILNDIMLLINILNNYGEVYYKLRSHVL